MSGFYDPFGGGSLKAADVSYRAVSLVASLETTWPAFANALTVLARTMNILAALPGLNIKMPDARQASPGVQTTFYNSASNSVQIQTADGTVIANVEPGGRRLVELIDNATAGGAWVVTLLGVGVGSLDVAAAAGAGLRALGTTLQVAYKVARVNSSRNITDSDRDYVLIWTGGAGTLTLNPASGLPAFTFGIRNQGTGALTIQPQGGETIDGVASIILNNTEACWINADSDNISWHTVGRGRNAQFNFTQLQKTVTGGTVALSLTEAANVVQTYTGALLSNVDIVLPSVVQVYYISNQTTGAFNFRLKNAGVGSIVSLPSGQNAVIFSDGTNVINASTTVAGIGQITFGAGTVSAPSVAVGAINTGFFAPSSNSVGFSSSGTQTVTMGSTGLTVSLAGNAKNDVFSTGANSIFTAGRPAGAEAGVQLNTNSLPRWFVGVDSTSESGSNAGSNFVIRRYDDTGVLIDAPFSIDRKTGIVKDKSTIGIPVMFMGDGVARAGYVLLDGSLLNRVAYPDLYAFALTTTPVSEAAWSAGQFGRFSVGNGSTTFRVPDLRAMTLRGLDLSRGIDVGRTWGSFQDHDNAPHVHGVTDPTHSHSLNDPGHTHGYSDPGHIHTGTTDTQGLHNHAENGAINTVTINAGVQAPAASAATQTTGNAGAHAHNVSVGANSVGISLYTAYTGQSLNGAATGISIQSSGAENRVKSVAYPYYTRI